MKRIAHLTTRETVNFLNNLPVDKQLEFLNSCTYLTLDDLYEAGDEFEISNGYITGREHNERHFDAIHRSAYDYDDFCA